MKLAQSEILVREDENLLRGPQCSGIAVSADISLGELYQKYFDVYPATTLETCHQAYALRHQVYCVEREFEPPSTVHPGLETDRYDAHATQIVLAPRGTNIVAGAVRLIYPVPGNIDDCLPIQAVCTDPLIRDREKFPVELMGEISRFCISKQFRQRIRDRIYAEDIPDYAEAIPPSDARRLIPHLTLGLIEQLISQSIAHGLRYWCAEMEPALLRLLAKLGIHFEPIGEPILYHGIRQPCMLTLKAMLERVYVERRDVWEILSDHGRHSDTLARTT